MASEKIQIERENGEIVDAQAPIIISASRSTDIPAFYADWFLHRLKIGYSAWVNPFNRVKSYVAYKNTRLVVFWSKNPKPLLNKDGLLDYLQANNINCYIQFTLNDYVAEKIEQGLPSIEDRLETFKRLVDRLEFGRVIWRFDPLILSDTINVDLLLSKIEHIGDQLKGYTEKLAFSYADIKAYRKVQGNLRNLSKHGINYREFEQQEMIDFARGLTELNKRWNFTLVTCAEEIDLGQFKIAHNRCIDDDLMIKYFQDDAKLMSFLGIATEQPSLFNPIAIITKKKNMKDKGQRKSCGCIISKDIGSYNTCTHFCEYCYANSSKEFAIKNYTIHKENPKAETITGN